MGIDFNFGTKYACKQQSSIKIRQQGQPRVGVAELFCTRCDVTITKKGEAKWWQIHDSFNHKMLVTAFAKDSNALCKSCEAQ